MTELFGISLEALLQTIGHVGIITIVFLESGVLFGIIFPGDSLLITAAFLAGQGYLSITTLIVGCTIAAILGDSVGYATGKYFGPKIFTREESIFFKKSHVEKAEHFFQKYGKASIIIARFTPVVRTLIPIMAGVGNMHYKTFLTYNIVGALIWATGLLSLSYLAVLYVPGVKDSIEYIVLAIIFISLLPIARQLYIELFKKKTISTN